MSLAIQTVAPMIATAQAATPAIQKTVRDYEVLRGLKNSTACTGAGRSDVSTRLDLVAEIKASDYNNKSFSNKSFSPLLYQKNSFKIPGVLGSDSSFSCSEALQTYIDVAYNGDNKSFLRYYYNVTGESPYELKEKYLSAAAGKDLNNKLEATLSTLISGRTESFDLWRDRIIQGAFRDCYSWDKDRSVDYPEPSSKNGQNKYNSAYWKGNGDNEKVVGYRAAIALSGVYANGSVKCSAVKSFVLSPNNRHIMDFDFKKELDERGDDYENDKKVNDILGLFITNNDGITFCVAAHGGDALKAASQATYLRNLAEWIVGGATSTFIKSAPEGQGGSLNVSSAEKFAACLGKAYPTLEEILAFELPDYSEEAEDTGDLGDGCSTFVLNPLAWIICPVIEVMEFVTNRFFTAANDALNFSFTGTGSEEPFYEAWSSIRNIANILFIIAFLFIIISQTLAGKF